MISYLSSPLEASKYLISHSMREFFLTFLSFFIFMVFIGGIFWFDYQNRKDDFYTQIDKTLISSAKGQLFILPNHFHDTIQKMPLNVQTDKKNIALLTQYARIMNVKYVYTLIQINGKIRFSASSMRPEDQKSGKISYFYDLYDDAPVSAYHAFKTKKIVFDEYNDQWGHVRSVFIPLKTAQGHIFIAAADIPIESIHTKLESLQTQYLFSLFLILFIGIPIILWRYTLLHNKLMHEIEINGKKEAQLQQQSSKAVMGEMIGFIAHQWRQPLNALKASVLKVHILNQTGRLSPDELYQSLLFIQDISQTMSSTIDDFMNFTKPDRNKEVIQIEDVVRNAIKIIDFYIGASNISLSIQIQENLQIYGYKNELSHILINLLSNAKDQFENKDYLLKNITIRAYENKQNCIIEIEDNAGGIDPNHIINIFDPYFTTKANNKGTGLGLYMSKKIIEDHFNGELTVLNTSKGAKFVIILSSHIENTKFHT